LAALSGEIDLTVRSTVQRRYFSTGHQATPGGVITMADLGDHDAPIFAITMLRSCRSRWAETRPRLAAGRLDEVVHGTTVATYGPTAYTEESDQGAPRPR
jgi:hypothetical protein